MIFEYTPVTAIINRPLVPVRISFRKKFILTKALVDSGSDYCIFPLDYAYDLGVSSVKSSKTIFRSFTGEPATISLYRINLAIDTHQVKITAGFTDSIGPYSYSVLGQKGFFDNFKVCFDKQKQQIEIEPK